MVLCNGKPQQSFRFRFSEFKTKELCLFINDLYQTAQLWEARKSPCANASDPVTNIDGVPDGYRAMNEHEAIKVMIEF